MGKMVFERCVRHHEKGEPAGEGTSYGQSWGQFAGAFDRVAGVVAKGKSRATTAKRHTAPSLPSIPNVTPATAKQAAAAVKIFKEKTSGKM